MRWGGLAAEVVMAITGIAMILYGHRLLGKAPGADQKHDAAIRRHASGNKLVGWSTVILAVIALLSHLLDVV
jgi:cytochrome b subunit of formate dehydrogenase